jgi:hypothetical protein
MDWQGFRYTLSYDGIIADDGVASVRNFGENQKPRK